MPGPTAPEMATKAIVKEAQPAAPATSSEKMVAGMTTKLQEQGYRASLEMARGPHVDGRKLGEKIDQIGVERDAASGAKTRTAAEQARFDEATATKDLLAKFLEGGLDKPPARGGLTNTQRLKLEQMVATEIMKRPELAREINGMNAAQQKAFMERYMRDPRFAEKAREILNDIAKSPELEDTVSDKQDSLRAAELERDAKQAEVTDIDRRITDVTTKLDRFDATVVGGRITGDDARELADRRTRLATAQTNLAAAKSERDVALTDAQSKRDEKRIVNSRGYTGPKTPAEAETELAEAERILREKEVAFRTVEAEAASLRDVLSVKRKMRETIRTEKISKFLAIYAVFWEEQIQYIHLQFAIYYFQPI